MMVLDNQSKNFDKHSHIKTEKTELLKVCMKDNSEGKQTFWKGKVKNVEGLLISIPISNHYWQETRSSPLSLAEEKPWID